MRTSWLCAFGASALLFTESLVWIAPAHADPAYTASSVVDLFAKEKAAKKLGAARKICFQSDPDCGAPAAQTATRFDLLVNFEFDSDRLTAAAKENLSQFAKALLDPQLKGTRFEIDGHTDAKGAEIYNLGLSDRRAKAVVEYLASQGVDSATLVAHGFGKSKPRVSDPFSPENRRVETHLLD
jgi:outer membrane protein OmpA-like peptidoglycan-associated protein